MYKYGIYRKTKQLNRNLRLFEIHSFSTMLSYKRSQRRGANPS